MDHHHSHHHTLDVFAVTSEFVRCVRDVRDFVMAGDAATAEQRSNASVAEFYLAKVNFRMREATSGRLAIDDIGVSLDELEGFAEHLEAVKTKYVAQVKFASLRGGSSRSAEKAAHKTAEAEFLAWGDEHEKTYDRIKLFLKNGSHSGTMIFPDHHQIEKDLGNPLTATDENRPSRAEALSQVTGNEDFKRIEVGEYSELPPPPKRDADDKAYFEYLSEALKGDYGDLPDIPVSSEYGSIPGADGGDYGRIPGAETGPPEGTPETDLPDVEGGRERGL